MARELARILEKSNYRVDVVYNGNNVENYLISGDYDVAILNVKMQYTGGIEVLKKIREKGVTMSVIMLSSGADIDDLVLVLDSGANDYLAKPFDVNELLARIRVVTRSKNSIDSKISFGNITLDRVTFLLHSPNGQIHLTNKEFQMMEILLINPTHVVSTERLLEKIWGFNADVEINVVHSLHMLKFSF